MNLCYRFAISEPMSLPVIITRNYQDAERTAFQFGTLPIEPIIAPMFSVEPLQEMVPLIYQYSHFPFQAILVTSQYAIELFALHCQRRDIVVYTVGTHTATVVRSYGFINVVICPAGNAVSLEETIRHYCAPSQGPLLYLRGKETAYDLEHALTSAGYQVYEIITYATKPTRQLSASVLTIFSSEPCGIVLFYSEKTAEIFYRLIQKEMLTDTLRQWAMIAISRKVNMVFPSNVWALSEIAALPNQTQMMVSLKKLIDTLPSWAPKFVK